MKNNQLSKEKQQFKQPSPKPFYNPLQQFKHRDRAVPRLCRDRGTQSGRIK